jgi:hypothetical protein
MAPMANPDTLNSKAGVNVGHDERPTGIISGLSGLGNRFQSDSIPSRPTVDERGAEKLDEILKIRLNWNFRLFLRRQQRQITEKDVDLNFVDGLAGPGKKVFSVENTRTSPESQLPKYYSVLVNSFCVMSY